MIFEPKKKKNWMNSPRNRFNDDDVWRVRTNTFVFFFYFLRRSKPIYLNTCTFTASTFFIGSYYRRALLCRSKLSIVYTIKSSLHTHIFRVYFFFYCKMCLLSRFVPMFMENLDKNFGASMRFLIHLFIWL